MLTCILNFAIFGTNSVQQNHTSETDNTTVDEEIPNSVQSGTHCYYKGQVPSHTLGKLSSFYSMPPTIY